MAKKLRIAAIGDIHVGHHTTGMYNELFAEISQKADVLLLCGDLTNRGLAEEAELLVTELKDCTIPTIAVLGNHDFEHDRQNEIQEILEQNRVIVLDGDEYVVDDVGFAGVKGLGGGFDSKMLTMFGERVMKEFVQETVDDVLLLEKALNELPTEKKVVVMHYSPTRSTVVGEPEEIFPFLGSSRYSDVIDRLGVQVAFHGHAHHGTHEGKTTQGVPVYNVAYPLLRNLSPPLSYKIVEV